MAAAKSGILKFNNKMYLGSTNNIFDDINMDSHIFARKHVGVELNEDIRMSKIAYGILIDFIAKFQENFQNFEKDLEICVNIEEVMQKFMEVGEFDSKIHKFFRKKLPVLGKSTVFNRLILQRDIKEFMRIHPIDSKVTLSGHMDKNVAVACLKIILLGVIGTMKSVVKYEIDENTGIFLSFDLIPTRKRASLRNAEYLEPNLDIVEEDQKEEPPKKRENCSTSRKKAAENVPEKLGSSSKSREKAAVKNREAVKKEQKSTNFLPPRNPDPNAYDPRYTEFRERSQNDPNLSEKWKETIRNVLRYNLTLIEDLARAEAQYEQAKSA